MISLGRPVLAAAAESAPDEELAEALQGLTATDWVTAAVIFFGAVAISGVVRSLAARLVGRGDDSRPAARLVGRVGGGLVVVGGFVYALQVLGVSLGPLLGALGLGGLALAFAAQSILENVFASVLLQTRRHFRRGDQIATNDIEGTVEEVNLRTVQLRTYDGELVLVPCAQVLGAPITNYTAKGSRRTTLAVGVGYETDLATAQRVLLGAMATVDGVRPEPAPQALVEQFGESSIDFAVRWWHAPDIATMWRVRSAVAMAVKGALDEAGIDIPFPHRLVGFLPGVELDVRMAGGEGGAGGEVTAGADRGEVTDHHRHHGDGNGDGAGVADGDTVAHADREP